MEVSVGRAASSEHPAVEGWACLRANRPGRALSIRSLSKAALPEPKHMVRSAPRGRGGSLRETCVSGRRQKSNTCPSRKLDGRTDLSSKSRSDCRRLAANVVYWGEFADGTEKLAIRWHDLAAGFRTAATCRAWASPSRLLRPDASACHISTIFPPSSPRRSLQLRLQRLAI